MNINKNIVVKDNALINASYHLELVEQRLILLSIIESRKKNCEIKSNEYITICAERYINEFGVHRNVAYKALKDACNHLFERRFSYQKMTAKGNKEIITSRWVQSISYIENEAIVRLKFSDDVAPLIHNLEKHFTSYQLEQVSKLKSKYAVRLYEIIIAWRTAGKSPMMTVDDLRGRLGVLNNEYTELKNLKARVINYAVRQINERTDISINYEQYKHGRKIVGFIFSVEQKNIQLAKTERKKWVKQKQKIKEKEVTEDQKFKHTMDWDNWDSIPDGTQFRYEDGTTWVRENGGFLRCPEKNVTAIPFQAREMFTNGKIIFIK